MIVELFNFINDTLGSYPFLLGVESASLLIKLALLIIVIFYGLRSSKIPRPWFYLVPILIGSMFANFAWVSSISRKLFFPDMDYRPVIFLVRMGWAFWIILYQSLALFIESLTEQEFTIKKWYQKNLYFF